jgi:cytochrome c
MIKEKKGTTSEQKTENTNGDLSDNPIYQKGLTIIGNSDCRTCHMIEEKNIGPAWRDVAKICRLS